MREAQPSVTMWKGHLFSKPGGPVEILAHEVETTARRSAVVLKASDVAVRLGGGARDQVSKGFVRGAVC